MDAALIEKEGPIGFLTLNRPEKRNALSLEVMTEIIAKLDEVGQDDGIKVLIIRGNGPVFSAGHDIRELSAQEDIHYFRKIFGVCNQMMLRLRRLSQPVIAQVHGIATAAGCQLVAACDLAVCESGARFATSGIKIGLFCSTPMVPLVRLIGRRRAMEMLLTGRFVSAQEALDFGLVNRVAPPERLAEETEKLALEIAQFSSFAFGLGKQAFYAQIDLDEKSAYDYAGEIMALNCMAEDAREGTSAFLGKRLPQWKGR